MFIHFLKISCALITSSCATLMTLHPPKPWESQAEMRSPREVMVDSWDVGPERHCFVMNSFQLMTLLFVIFLYDCISWKLPAVKELLSILCLFLRYVLLFTLGNICAGRNECCFGTLVVCSVHFRQQRNYATSYAIATFL